jgi:hypothetical protein
MTSTYENGGGPDDPPGLGRSQVDQTFSHEALQLPLPSDFDER